MKKTVALSISGRVQNVGFRYHTSEAAKTHDIIGFVKNESDGSVYVEATGEQEDLDHFILWCNKGPSWARVDRVQIVALPFQEYEDFVIK